MKTIVVTGAAGALGSAVVKKFVAGGDKVIGIVNHAHTLEDKDADLITADLSDEAATEKAVQQIMAQWGSIDVLICTAGGFAMGDIATTSMKEITAQNDINFKTAYHIARPVFGHMKARGSGRIFLVGSRAGLSARDGKGMLAYGLSKALLTYLSEAMNEEAKGTDVVTSMVVPSIIDTPANRGAMATADFTKWVSPEAIADIIHFYSSEAAASLREPVIKVYGRS